LLVDGCLHVTATCLLLKPKYIRFITQISATYFYENMTKLVYGHIQTLKLSKINVKNFQQETNYKGNSYH